MDKTKLLENIHFNEEVVVSEDLRCKTINFFVENGVSHPEHKLVCSWIDRTLATFDISSSQIDIYYVTPQSMQNCNHALRSKDKATDVLSIPVPISIRNIYLGDILVCPDYLAKTDDYYWAYMVIHSVLHLLDFTHDDDEKAEIMENHEKDILNKIFHKKI